VSRAFTVRRPCVFGLPRALAAGNGEFEACVLRANFENARLTHGFRGFQMTS